MPIGLKPGLVYGARHLCADVHGGRWAAEKQQNRDRDGRRGGGKAPADFCRYHGEVYGVAEGRLTVMKSDKDALTVGEDGFLGPFANEGDKVSWQVQAPWSGQFLLNVTFNGKWGGKQNSFVVNGGAPQTVAFPQTDEQGQQLRIPVTLKAGSNQIDFGRFAGDWGYMFIKSIEVVAE